MLDRHNASVPVTQETPAADNVATSSSSSSSTDVAQVAASNQSLKSPALSKDPPRGTLLETPIQEYICIGDKPVRIFAPNGPQGAAEFTGVSSRGPQIGFVNAQYVVVTPFQDCIEFICNVIKTLFTFL